MEKPFEKLKRLEDELKKAKSENNLNDIFTIYLNIGEFCLNNDAVDYGIKLLQEALNYSKNIPNIHKIYELLGHLFLKNGILEEALEHYKIYIEALSKNDDYHNQAIVLFKMGKILMLQEKFDDAIKKFRESEKVYQVYADYSKQAQLLYDIGVDCKRRTITYSPDMRNLDGIADFSSYGGISSGPRSALLKKTAKKSFKKAFKILEKQDMLDSESELALKLKKKLNS